MKTLLILPALMVLSLPWFGFGHAAELPANGKLAPLFQLPDQTGKTHTLADYRGGWVVLYFIPRTTRPVAPRKLASFATTSRSSPPWGRKSSA